MTQFPLLWIERRNYSSFRNIEDLGFDPDYEQWWEDYKRVVTELHRERYAILPVEFDGREFENHCKPEWHRARPGGAAALHALEGNGICGVTRG